MLRQHQKALSSAQVILDSLFIIWSLVLSYGIHLYSSKAVASSSWWDCSRFVLVALPIYLITYRSFHLYESYRSKTIILELGRIMQSNILAFAVAYAVTKLFQIHLPDSMICVFAMINISVSFISRFVLRRILKALRAKGYNTKFMLIVGWNRNAETICNRICEHKYLGYQIIGIISSNKPDEKYVHLGNMEYLTQYLAVNIVDEVIISLDYKDYNSMQKAINTCEKFGVKAGIIPFYTEFLPAKPFVEEVDGMPVINLRMIPLENFINSAMKRIIDIIGSIALLILLSPIFIVTAIGVKSSSKGKVLYIQERVGLDKKRFNMYKFRSMRESTDESDKTAWSTKDDPRRTKFGTLIRKYSIDELPQLFNVLKGDMSLVGPRPEIPHHVLTFQESIPRYMVKHQIRPGMTGWAQVNGWRGDTSIEERINCDLYYIENWSLLFDIKILILTIIKGVRSKSE